METDKHISKQQVINALEASKKDHRQAIEHIDKAIRMIKILGEYNPKQHTLSDISIKQDRSIVVRHQELGSWLQHNYPTIDDFDKHRFSFGGGLSGDTNFCEYIWKESGQTISQKELRLLSHKYLMPKVEVL
jgi:hypothetical protein